MDAQTFVVDGQEGKSLTVMKCRGNVKHVIVQKGNYTYKIQLNYGNDMSEQTRVDVVDKIFSTFKFSVL